MWVMTSNILYLSHPRAFASIDDFSTNVVKDNERPLMKDDEEQVTRWCVASLLMWLEGICWERGMFII